MTGIAFAVAAIGLALLVLGLIPPTRAHVPWGVNTGIGLIITGVVLYVLLAVLA